MKVEEIVMKYDARQEELKKEYGISKDAVNEMAVDKEYPKTWRQAMASPNIQTRWWQSFHRHHS